MTITIGAISFDRVDYDREVDVLYLTSGDPADGVDFDETPEGHGVATTPTGTWSASRSWERVACSTRTGR
jgi:hypothetical protein